MDCLCAGLDVVLACLIFGGLSLICEFWFVVVLVWWIGILLGFVLIDMIWFVF